METVYRINDESWDDESYDVYYHDENYSVDDESILGSIGNAIKSGVGAVGSILTGNPLGAVKNVGTAIGSVLGVNPVPALTTGIQNTSNLAGQIITGAGKNLPFKLPATIATKQDINILQSAIARINSEIKKVADANNANGLALTRLSKEVKTVDQKHIMATKKQNEMITKLGASNDRLQKTIAKMKSQNQMNMMMPLLMQPKLESIQFEKPASGAAPVQADGTKYNVSSSASSDNSMLFMMMAMSGDEGGFGDMGSNPMMLYFMMEAMNK
ncbi:hypothetical protein [Flavihumibacter sp. ZG627]|uniref:hypothetical protein n=1 Tax=Flavihumibacter sp. ZG627 TaxID=1463156 RepID=UPI0005801195|nr:hypothetical protein [Flavihumibacter sp. ZG627]KIC89133.1 hypothetical protein HY58_18430 [Flavihumibacter sp. ZG627]